MNFSSIVFSSRELFSAVLNTGTCWFPVTKEGATCLYDRGTCWLVEGSWKSYTFEAWFLLKPWCCGVLEGPGCCVWASSKPFEHPWTLTSIDCKVIRWLPRFCPVGSVSACPFLWCDFGCCHCCCSCGKPCSTWEHPLFCNVACFWLPLEHLPLLLLSGFWDSFTEINTINFRRWFYKTNGQNFLLDISHKRDYFSWTNWAVRNNWRWRSL